MVKEMPAAQTVTVIAVLVVVFCCFFSPDVGFSIFVVSSSKNYEH